jgi:hypothetical protein
MAAQPGIVQRTEQPYAAIRALVTMQTLGEVLPGLHPEDLEVKAARGDRKMRTHSRPHP